jgi:hypothetical protein
MQVAVDVDLERVMETVVVTLSEPQGTAHEWHMPVRTTLTVVQ